jgi:arginine decarboxylase
MKKVNSYPQNFDFKKIYFKKMENQTKENNNETKNNDHKSETSQTEEKKEELSMTEISERVLNKRILRKFRNSWKLGIKEFNTQYFSFNQKGELIILEGNYQYNVKDLVEKYGTSLEIYLPFVLKERLEDLMDLFRLFIKYYKYHGKFYYHYPMKVNQNKEYILSLVAEGANLEAGSYNELYLVKKLWEQGNFHSDIRVICNGPKTENYLRLIEELRNNNLSIIPIIEDFNELKYLEKYKGEVGIRVDLNVKVSSHWDKKINRYGFLAEEILKLGKIRNLTIIHYHIGSQIELQEDIMSPVKKAMELFIKLKRKNPSLDTINIGGGMPIPYSRKRKYGIEGVIKNIIRYLQKKADKKDICHPNIICEWGRYVVAPAQITIFKVIGAKTISKGNAKKWYIIDGSFMNDLLDTWALHQKWHVVPANNAYAKKLSRTWLAGSSCDSDDKYIAHGNYILLPSLEYLNDGESLYVAFLDSGAYQDALSSHHCLLSAPARIMAQNGETKLIRKRETPEDVGKLFGW